jgi:hypothetical protein
MAPEANSAETTAEPSKSFRFISVAGLAWIEAMRQPGKPRWPHWPQPDHALAAPTLILA